MKYEIATKNILGSTIKQGESYRIIGAGISGLLLGYYMKKNGIPFRIYEKGSRAGGLINTLELEGLGLAEQAANGFVWCEELANLCKDIGLEIQSPDEDSKARYLVRNNELAKSWRKMDQLLIKNYPNVRLLGNYTGQVSVRGIAQFIRKAFV